MSAIALTGLKRYGAVAVATLPGAVAALLPLQHSNSAAATAAMHPQHPFISAPWPAQQWRAFVSSRPAADLRDFLDGIDPDNVTHGRAWLAKELRNKSWDDLHKLWYVCLKERNMLLTQMDWEQRAAGERGQNSAALPRYIERYCAVKRSMSRIKTVLSERACNEADATKAADMKRVIHYM